MSAPVAVLADRFLGWTGGRIYLANLLRAVADVPERPRLVAITSEGGAGDVLAAADEVVIVGPPGLTARAVERARRRFTVAERLPGGALRRVRPAALFGNGLGARFGRAAVVANVLDYQDRFYPHLSTPERLAVRERQEARVAGSADGILFNSRHSLEGFTRRHTRCRAATGIVPLLPSVSPADLATDPPSVAKKYGLPERFVILPSQLWEHKNHLQVLEAMAVLQARRVDLVAVLCGAPYDPRSPRYVSRLLQAASALGVRHRVVLLGELERAELVALMRQSLGFIQPALHEGGGLPAEEARLLGKRIVLADLPLQREAAVPGTSFFAPGDAGSLADVIEEAFAGVAPGVDVEAEDQAIAAARTRVAAAGAAFVRLVADAVERRGPGRREGAPA